METKALIYRKLEEFIRKFYLNELIKGSIFFVGLGLLYFLFTILLEYFLWFQPIQRTILFVLFVLVEAFLLLRYILFPVFKMFKIQQGIGYVDASKIIGNHFSNVNDKLTNFLQLINDSQQSELLLASIDQKAKDLQPIPFVNAVNFKKNKAYLPLAIIPFLFFIFFYISGNSDVISQSLNRVVHFNKQYNPPAPFEFQILSKNLQTQQGNDYILRIKTIGKVVPENAMIFINNENYYMQSSQPGYFEFKFQKPVHDISFHIEANDVRSSEYNLSVISVPSIANLEMKLDFPSYLHKKSEVIKGTGNAVIPEGTVITWKINTLSTESVTLSDYKNLLPFSEQSDVFSLARKVNQNIDYQIITSNKSVKNFDKLSYQLSVVKDLNPTIEVTNVPDSLKADKSITIGKISDDYGLSKLQVVYYPSDKPSQVKRAMLPVKHDNFDQFVFVFPSTLPVEQGVSYQYYFEVFDNDAPHNFKSTKSTVFSNRLSTEDEKQSQILQEQSESIQGLSKSVQRQDKQISELNKLEQLTKEKNSLEFNDQKKINDFIKSQHEQDKLIENYTSKLRENLDKMNNVKDDSFKKDLQNRLDNVQKDLDKNKDLLKELNELNDKIKKDELSEKMDQFKQNSKNQVKSLEQLLELTKKFYVEQKAEKVADQLNKLSEKQDKLSDQGNENTSDKQDKINSEFDQIQKDLQDLQKENKELKSPLDIPNDAQKQNDIDKDLNGASEELKKQNSSKAQLKQKSASKKMKQMSQTMSDSMSSGEMEQMEEDVAMLRQILDNLLAFSFSQENLMMQFKNQKSGSPSFSKDLKLQQDLKNQFQHVDDSLFAMSLRNPKIGEKVTKEIGDVEYNLSKAISSFVDSLISKGVSHQQYIVSGANRLADMLSELLSNMQQSLSQSGSGKGKSGQGQGMQLSDIIKKQDGISDKMKQGMKPGSKPGSKPGEGQTGKGSNGQEGGDGEGEAESIMEIYKEQKQLREALQNELNKQGLGNNGQAALNQMKDVEKQLLDKGFKNDVLEKIFNIKQELLKLDKAVKEQGQEEKRQAESSKKQYNSTANTLPNAVKEYYHSIEILNRQSLPLRANYNQKLKDYFKKP